MNAPTFHRREFAAALGGIVLSFSLDAAARARRSRAQLPGSLDRQPHARCLDPHQCRRHRDRVHRQGRARAGHPHGARADRGRGARPAAVRAIEMISGDTGRTPERGPDRGQPVDREQRHGAADGGRRGARDPDRSRRQAARRRGRYADGRRWRDHRAATAARSAMASSPPTLDLNREATAKVRPKPPAEHKIVGTLGPAAATFPPR